MSAGVSEDHRSLSPAKAPVSAAAATAGTAAKSHAKPLVEFNWENLKQPRFMADKVLEAYRELENLRRPRKPQPQYQDEECTTEKEQAWFAAFESFMHYATYTLRFVKKIPGTLSSFRFLKVVYFCHVECYVRRGNNLPL